MKILIAIIILSCAIFVHELGHFIFAKLSKVRVNEFALGMGPKLFSFKKGETTYVWRLLPIGGMCVMQGEDEEDYSQGSFQSAKVWKRILIVAAGPLFNFLLAFVVALVVLFNIGIDPATAQGVNESSNAYAAGLRDGDLITAFQGHSIANARELYMYIMIDGVPEDEISLSVSRDGQKYSVDFTPDVINRYLLGFSYDPNGEELITTQIEQGLPLAEAGLQAGDKIVSLNGNDTSTYELFDAYISEHPLSDEPINVGYEREGQIYETTVTPLLYSHTSAGFSFNMGREKAGFFKTVSYSFGEIKYCITSTVKSIASLFTGRFSVKDLSGPVGVVSVIGEVYDQAAPDGAFYIWMSMLNMMILLSANLGIMNLLPLPALDGGRLIFLFIECIRRKPCNQKIEGMVHFIGIVALLALAAFVAFNDVLKLI